MKKILFFCLFAAAVFPCFGANAYLGYLYPSGGRRGTTVRVIAGGQDINGNVSLISSMPGIRLKSAVPVPALTNLGSPQKAWVLAWLRALYLGSREAPPLPAPGEKSGREWKESPWLESMAELPPLERSLLAEMLLTRTNALQAAPSLAKRVILELEIAPDAPLGPCRLRLAAGPRVTNEKLFFIDEASHTNEPLFTPSFAPPEISPVVSRFPAVLNGQILPGECDEFSVRLEKDVSYTFAMTGARLSPFLGDAVPGHLQGVLSLFDESGAEIAFADDEYHHPDPVLRCTPKKTGVFLLRVSDALRRGRADFVYRISVVPENLEFQPWEMKSSFRPMEKVLSVKEAGTVIETSGLTPGLDLRGTLPAPGGIQKFKIHAVRGEQLVFEVLARRSDSPVDGVLTLRGPSGKILAENDDMPSNLTIDLCSQNVDPGFSATIPEDGIYELELRDRTDGAGKDYFYRLQIRRPQEDVFVYSHSSVLVFDGNGIGKLKFSAVRIDGFHGDIKIVSEELIPVDGKNIIPAGADGAELVFQSDSRKRVRRPEELSFQAEVIIHGETVRRDVVPADETMQAFAYTHRLTAKTIYGVWNKKSAPARPEKKSLSSDVSPN